MVEARRFHLNSMFVARREMKRAGVCLCGECRYVAVGVGVVAVVVVVMMVSLMTMVLGAAAGACSSDVARGSYMGCC